MVLLLSAPTARPGERAHTDRLSFWDTQRRGANFFNEVETRERFRAAREAGLEWVRLVPDKWTGRHRDFLIGDAGNFRGLVPEDLAHLKKVLGWAESEGVPVVTGMLNLPGCRWVQHNGGKQDYRLWNEERYQVQAAAFWRELASHLKDHPAVVAYNPLNEPHPARQDGHDDADAEGFPSWLEAHRGTTADLDRFNARIVRAIREARKANKGRYAYPDAMPAYWNGPAEEWGRDVLGRKMDPVAEWAARHGVPPNRIVVAEFGCDRGAPGAREYLEDVVTALNGRGWHWAFYSFREDVWDRMDYEVGPGGLGAAYWEAVDRGETPERPRKDNPLWRVLQEGLKADR
jgi:hypothetical protein